MKKIFIALSLFAAMGSTAFAQVEGEQPASFILDESGNLTETTAPVFEFENETHDFGTLPEGPKVTYEFKFKNIGKEDLVIKTAKGSCGCTVPEWPTEAIKPGETGVIKATYNTQGRPGPFNKSITLTSNAYTPTKRLFIKGTVEKAAEQTTTPEKPKSLVNDLGE
jgi:hypothetical protein